MWERAFSRSRVRFLQAMAVLALLGPAACTSGSAATKGNVWYVRASGPAPAIAGRALTGGTVAASDAAGKILVVNFWNYDCPPCQHEQPLLQSAWDRFQRRGVQFIGLMFVGGSPPWPNDPASARRYLQRFSVSYPVLIDQGSSLARAFNVPGIPITVVVDRRGQMRFRVIGELHAGRLETLIRLAGGPEPPAS
jgi:peroxiredoxin